MSINAPALLAWLAAVLGLAAAVLWGWNALHPVTFTDYRKRTLRFIKALVFGAMGVLYLGLALDPWLSQLFGIQSIGSIAFTALWLRPLIVIMLATAVGYAIIEA